MPPRVVGPPRKEACIIIMDVGASMGKGSDDAKGSGLDKAQQAVKMSQSPIEPSRAERSKRLTAEQKADDSSSTRVCLCALAPQ